MSAAFDATPRLEKYELLEELGHGGMATVYRARDRRLGREVAVKIIHRHLRDEREVKERFSHEARAVAKLRHPGIVEVYDVSEVDEAERYLVVELVTGITLRKLISEHAPLPPELVLGIGIRLAEALHHAHENGVVHRDVKPENVLIALPPRLRPERSSDNSSARPSSARNSNAALPSRQGVEVKLTDFGIAKVLDAQGVTSTGEVLGSPAHMAPEQIEGHAVGPQADIFSLGVLLYEALVGSLPFSGNNPAQVLRRVLEGTFASTDRARPEVGSLIGRIVDKALAHAPEQRFENAEAFAVAMRTELGRTPITEPLIEIADFLSTPKDYVSAYVPRILPALLEGAKSARKTGRIPLATALFNRALSLRPSDPEILREVAQLTRMRRLRVRVLPITLGALMFFALLGAAHHFHAFERISFRPSLPRSARVPKLVNAAATPAKPEQAAQAMESPGDVTKTAPVSTAVGNGVAGSTPEPRRVMGTPRANGRLTKPVSLPVGLRTVRVELRGAKGSRLLIDGQERPWFGEKHELSVGPHRFDVVAPTDNCCIVPAPRIVQVEAGEGDLRVVLSVEFREALLLFAGSQGATLSCGELFPGALEAPGRRAIRLTQAETRATCTLIPAEGSGKSPRTIDVVLRPGGTFTVDGS